MSYKVQLKDKGSMIIDGEKYPFNQIRTVSKKVFEYIKVTFPTKFNFFGEPERKVVKTKESKVEERAKEKVTEEGKGYTRKSSKK